MSSSGRIRNGSPVYQEAIEFDNLTSNKARNRLLYSLTNAQGSTKRSKAGIYSPPTWKKMFRKYRSKLMYGIVIFLIVYYIVQNKMYGKDSLIKLNQNHGSHEEIVGGNSLSNEDTILDLVVDVSHPESIPLCRPVMDTNLRSCTCKNPLKPYPGPNLKWNEIQKTNEQKIDPSVHYDILFVGDSITYYWNKVINDKDHDDNRNTILAQSFPGWSVAALGIPGDTISSLLYRLNVLKELDGIGTSMDRKQGALKVIWILIGTNDMSFGCSDEIIYTGIVNYVGELLKITEDEKSGLKDATIVINGILPRSSLKDGRLVSIIDVLNPRDPNAPEIDDVDQESFNNHNSGESFDFWPSIKRINKALRTYASKNDKIEYYDASEIFVGRIGNRFFHKKDEFLMKELQYDFLHPTSLGYLLWAKDIQDYITSDLDIPDPLKAERL